MTGHVPARSAWQTQFGGRTDEEETALFRQQARDVLRGLQEEFKQDDGGQPLSEDELRARQGLVASLFRDLIDLKKRATKGAVIGSGLQGDRDSEWCFPLRGNDNQLGELKHPVLVNGRGSTEFFGWQFRMYFAAPLVEPALVLFLVFGRKPSGGWKPGSWRRVQKRHIRRARQEFATWNAGRRIGHTPAPGGG